MFGSGLGLKRDDGLPSISSTNIFSALESRRRKSSKKRSDKEKSDPARKNAAELPQIWTPTPVTVKSWADCEDDDDFFATPALPPVWSSEQPTETADGSRDDLSQEEESEGDEEIEEEADEENEGEPETEAIELAADEKQVSVGATVAREPDRQLSKKELKKKGLAELEAVLAELGLNQKDENDLRETTDDKKGGTDNAAANGEGENLGDGSVLTTESKSSKRRKAKKEKPFKEGREEEGLLDTNGASKEDAGPDDAEANSVPADPKEVVKKLASMRKKKASKESDAAAKAAAAEAAARAARLAAAKKKEKNHYNQQPVR